MDLKQAEFFYSGVFWVPWNFLIYFLFFEHYARDMRNPQSQIMLCLALGSTCRCLWFFLYHGAGKAPYLLILNRVAILLQFTAVSILMLMWLRAVKISRLTDREIQQLERSISRTNFNSTDTTNSDQSKTAPDHGPQSNSDNNGISKEQAMQRLKSLRIANESVVQRCVREKQFRNYHIIVVAANVVVWIMIMCSLVSPRLYDLNILLISLLCMCESVATLIVGLRVGFALRRALAPALLQQQQNDGIVLDSTQNSAQQLQQQPQQQEQQQRWWGNIVLGTNGSCCAWWGDCVGLYALIFCWDKQRQGLRMQREVLKVVLSVSAICAIFFLLRSFGFMYRPIVVNKAGYTANKGVEGDLFYPFLFYQLPELIPALAIARGISPPQGILRRLSDHLCLLIHQLAAHCLCCCSRTVPQNQQNSTTTASDTSGSTLEDRSAAIEDSGVDEYAESRPDSSVFIIDRLSSFLRSGERRRSSQQPAHRSGDRSRGATLSSTAEDYADALDGSAAASRNRTQMNPMQSINPLPKAAAQQPQPRHQQQQLQQLQQQQFLSQRKEAAEIAELLYRTNSLRSELTSRSQSVDDDSIKLELRTISAAAENKA